MFLFKTNFKGSLTEKVNTLSHFKQNFVEQELSARDDLNVGLKRSFSWVRTIFLREEKLLDPRFLFLFFALIRADLHLNEAKSLNRF